MHKVEIFVCILWKIFKQWKILVFWMMWEILRDFYGSTFQYMVKLRLIYHTDRQPDMEYINQMDAD